MTARSVVQSNPEILGGEPVFAGTRVPVRNLIDYLEHGSALMALQRGCNLGLPISRRMPIVMQDVEELRLRSESGHYRA